MKLRNSNSIDISSITPNLPVSYLYNGLLKFHRLSTFRRLKRIWQRMWNYSAAKYQYPVKTVIHGQGVYVNNGYTYPLSARRFRTFNNPLIELVFFSHASRNKKVNLLDVGAAVGDTVLLLLKNCPSMLGQITCVDGDWEFFRYLNHNLGKLENVFLIRAMLSSEEGSERELIHIHTGTASAQGENLAPVTTLDQLCLKNEIDRIDVIKIDVDGFDGKVLLGARDTLTKYHPEVIFEWHPILYKQTGNDWITPFELLTSLGYDRFVWFDKFGKFSQFCEYNPRTINATADLCLHGKFESDWHYDIVALHSSSPIDEVELAECMYSKRKVSKY